SQSKSQRVIEETDTPTSTARIGTPRAERKRKKPPSSSRRGRCSGARRRGVARARASRAAQRAVALQRRRVAERHGAEDRADPKGRDAGGRFVPPSAAAEPASPS